MQYTGADADNVHFAPEKFKDLSRPYVEVCQHATGCEVARCKLVHFELRSLPQTEPSLGDCSYLNACHHLDVCRYKHYRPATPSEEEASAMSADRRKKEALKLRPEKLYPPQWIDCDLRKLDVTVLGKFDVIMADPPWDSEYGKLGLAAVPYYYLPNVEHPLCTQFSKYSLNRGASRSGTTC